MEQFFSLRIHNNKHTKEKLHIYIEEIDANTRKSEPTKKTLCKDPQIKWEDSENFKNRLDGITLMEEINTNDGICKHCKTNLKFL